MIIRTIRRAIRRAWREAKRASKQLPKLILVLAILYVVFQLGGWYRIDDFKKEVKRTIMAEHKPGNTYTIPQLDLKIYPFTDVKFTNDDDNRAFRLAKDARKNSKRR